MSTDPKTGNLPITLATWIFILDDAGHQPDNAALQLACKGLREAEKDSLAAKGEALVEAVVSELGDDHSFEGVQAFVGRVFGADSIKTDLGESREDRVRSARSYQFKSSLPWVAEIIDRFPDGVVGSHWVMVERVTETVTCMDPYPWDDLDEEYEAPVVEFMVKWELAGGRSLRWEA